MFTGPEPPKIPINIEGKDPQNFFCTNWKPCYKRRKMEKSLRGWMLPNITKFRYQIKTSLNYTGLHPEMNRNLSEIV